MAEEIPSLPDSSVAEEIPSLPDRSVAGEISFPQVSGVAEETSILSGVTEEISNAQTRTPTGPIRLEALDSDSVGKEFHNNRVPRPLAMDLAEEIRGMYRLLDLVSESGSNGCGNEHSQDALFTC